MHVSPFIFSLSDTNVSLATATMPTTAAPIDCIKELDNYDNWIHCGSADILSTGHQGTSWVGVKGRPGVNEPPTVDVFLKSLWPQLLDYKQHPVAKSWRWAKSNQEVTSLWFHSFYTVHGSSWPITPGLDDAPNSWFNTIMILSADFIYK